MRIKVLQAFDWVVALLISPSALQPIVEVGAGRAPARLA